MSVGEPADERRPGGGPGTDDAQGRTPHDPEGQRTSETDPEAPPEEETDTPQNAWSARRELLRHSPGIMLGSSAAIGGSLVARDQHGVSGGQVTGDIIMGGKTEIHYVGTSGPAYASGDLPQDVLERLTGTFAGSTAFETALERLRADRVVVLSGAHFTGRRTAALNLLRHAGAAPVKILDPDISPTALPQELTAARGFLLCDLVTHRDQPLRESHLRAVQGQLAEHGGWLVITAGPHAVVEDTVQTTSWHPPPPEDVLRAHLSTLVGDEAREAQLLSLKATGTFLSRKHQLRETVAFARALAAYGEGRTTTEELDHFSLGTVQHQVEEWFDDKTASLHDKAFLVALAAFDQGPYALTAELSDQLFADLQKTEDPHLPARIPVFGTSIAKRLQMARAHQYEADEETEWGKVRQTVSAFRDERTPLVLLIEVWTGHPSARPALVRWLRRLADDGRPLVRNRAAATAAVLAAADLPSAMALLIEPWATARRYRFRLAAANALTLAHVLDTPNIPRILHDWCTEEKEGARWTAIRAYALIGPELPQEALAALAEATRKADRDEPDEEEATELALSTALLLLSTAGSQVLSGLVGFFQDERTVRDLALRAFLEACARPENDEEGARPALLAWHARAGADPGSEDDRQLTVLWRAVLADRTHTGTAVQHLRDWVRQADTDPESEAALGRLLPALAVSGADRQRLDHLLRTLPGEHGPLPPPVAARLLATLHPLPADVRS
ncbi:hypothetical protein [Streptomyces decoyicus]|uniref:hypothetical protein n=1 Tax=Streptomyces decoyicus TaxID=249567 RepID=UPI0037F37F88